MSEDYERFLDDLVDLCNSQEASWVKLRLQIEKALGQAKPSARLPFDVSKIIWQDRESARGEVRRKLLYEKMQETLESCDEITW